MTRLFAQVPVQSAGTALAGRRFMRLRFFGIPWLLMFLLAAASRAGAQGAPTLEHGYRLMYGLEFDAADREFVEWEALNPGDPLSAVSRAAALLFRELDRLGILQGQLFQDDETFTSRSRPEPDPSLRVRFDQLLADAESRALARLARAPQDRDALFAVTLTYGLRADYTSLIEKHNLAALSYTRRATSWATTLLSAAPDYYDAYLPTGISAYILGSLPAPVRWAFGLAGYQTDKGRGINDLTLAAERGRLLAPFARILLAVAALRAHDTARARSLLTGLARDFPSNPLFERELRRLE